jgi:hypothetical protein
MSSQVYFEPVFPGAFSTPNKRLNTCTEAYGNGLKFPLLRFYPAAVETWIDWPRRLTTSYIRGSLFDYLAFAFAAVGHAGLLSGSRRRIQKVSSIDGKREARV